jgi:hypothetical protein
LGTAVSLLVILLVLLFFVTGCRQYDDKLDIAYFFKTDPEKAVLDFLYALNSHDADYIYDSLLLDSDRRNISREKFIEEMDIILAELTSIKVEKIVYLGYEEDMGKVVVEFSIIYLNDESASYKKYVYLKEENGTWKIVLDKTFI